MIEVGDQDPDKRRDGPKLGRMNTSRLSGWRAYKSGGRGNDRKTTDQQQSRNVMQSIIRYSVFIGIIWFVFYLASIIAPELDPSGSHSGLYINISTQISNIGLALGSFVRPPLQIALILIVLIEAARRVGLLPETGAQPAFQLLSTATVQGTIALLIVGAVSVGALGYGDVGTLKDLALVVVGFYFGTKRSQAEAEAIATGTALAAAAAPSSSDAPAAPSAVSDDGSSGARRRS